MAPVRWGVLGTAKIAIPLIEGVREAAGDAAGDRRREPRRRQTARNYAEEHGVPRAIEGYDALLADAGHRRGLHLPAQRHAPRLDDARAGSGQARPVREAVHAAGRRGGGGVRPRGGVRPAAVGGLHVAPQPADAAAARGARRRSAGWSRCTPRSASGWRTRRTTASTPVDGGSLMDVGCYCINGSRMIAGEEPVAHLRPPRAGPGPRRPAHDRRAGVPERLHGDLRVLVHGAHRRASRWSASTASSASPTRGTPGWAWCSSTARSGA